MQEKNKVQNDNFVDMQGAKHTIKLILDLASSRLIKVLAKIGYLSE